jgi:hypothetical protein
METGPNVKFARRVSQQDSLLSVVLSATYGTSGFMDPEAVLKVRIPLSPPYFQALTRPAIRSAIR